MNSKHALEILELHKTASFDEIKQAYGDLAFVWHPDRHISNTRRSAKAHTKMKEINEAYDFLSSLHKNASKAKSNHNKERKAKSDHNEETVFVKCKKCNAQNRIVTSHGGILKCGKCGYPLFADYSADDDSERILCGDGNCIGLIYNSRCKICGLTIEEGKQRDQLRTFINQQAHDARLKKEKKKRNFWIRFKFGLFALFALIVIYSIVLLR